LPRNTVFYARARHRFETEGWGAWGAVTIFTTINAMPIAPTIYNPTDGAVDVSPRPQVLLSTFSNTGPADTAAATEIQIASDESFENIAATYEGSYITSWQPSAPLELLTQYYVRARVQGTTWGWSEWSATHGFVTVNAYLNAPAIISPADGATDVWLAPAIVTAEPDYTGQDIIQKQVQISTASTFDTVFWDSGEIAYTDDNSTTVGTTLATGTQYYARARLKGSATGWTDWSAAVGFTSQSVAVNQVWNYTSSGTFTAPATGKYTLEAAGGGGGGSYCSMYDSPMSASGGTGGYAKSVNIALTKGQTVTVSVGGGGSGISMGPSTCGPNKTGGSGGTSSIAGYVSATGGGGGKTSCSVSNDGDGGTFYNCISATNGSNGSGSGGNTTNQSGGGGSGGSGNARGSAGWAKITYTGP
jgi:hypothetical protein